MKITEDVRKFPAQQQISEEGALQVGLEQKAREFVEKGSALYVPVRSTSTSEVAQARNSGNCKIKFHQNIF